MAGRVKHLLIIYNLVNLIIKYPDSSRSYIQGSSYSQGTSWTALISKAALIIKYPDSSYIQGTSWTALISKALHGQLLYPRHFMDSSYIQGTSWTALISKALHVKSTQIDIPGIGLYYDRQNYFKPFIF